MKLSSGIRTNSCSKILLLILFSALTVFSSCSKKAEAAVEEIPEEPAVQQNDTHRWYSFTRDGFEEIPLPRLAQKPAVKAWTEAARISSSAATENHAFFTANRRGILIVDKKGNVTLESNALFFPTETIGSLFLDEGNPVFHVYRNGVFNTEDTAHEVASPFIAEYNMKTDIFYPVLYRDDFGMADTQEVSSVTVIDGTLFVSIKDMGKKTSFDYYRVVIPSTFTETASAAHVRTLDGTPISQEDFQKASNPLSFSIAPERLKGLLSDIPSSVKYSITYQTTGSRSTPVTYLHGFTADTMDSIITEAHAFVSGSWAAALFPDGTMYFQGSLPDRFAVAAGKSICFSMPELPEGFIYTDFAISGDFMTAGWEESGVFKTGAAGFIIVDLSKVLY